MICLLCELERDGRRECDWVHRDDHWSVGIFPGLEVPGWLVLHTRAHREGWEQLHPNEAQGLAGLLPGLSGAMRAETGAERIYQVVFGDNHPHFHTLLAPRVPGGAAGPGLLVDPPPTELAAAHALAAAIRRRIADPVTQEPS